MKKLLTGLFIFVCSVGSIWAYTPTTTDTQLINKITTLMQDVEQVQLNQIKLYLGNVQTSLEEDSKKYRLAERLIEEIEKIGAWRSLTLIYANETEEWLPDIDAPMVANGDTISVDYIWSLTDGSIFDTSLQQIAIDAWSYNPARAYEPLEFTVGAGQMIAWFDAGVVGMRVGENKKITILPVDGYGERSEEAIQKVPKAMFDDSWIVPVIWDQHNFGFTLGTIIWIDDELLTVDFNHFLAGETLVFEVTVMSID